MPVIGENPNETLDRAREVLVKNKQYELRQFAIDQAIKLMDAHPMHPRNVYRIADDITNYVLTGEHPNEPRDASPSPARNPLGGLHPSWERPD